MAGNITQPYCAGCGQRIGVYEPIWLEFGNGTLLSTSLLNIDQEPSSEQQPERLLHLGCLAPDQIPQSQAG